MPLTLDGLKACKTIRTEMNRLVNVTLCFSANQALLAAKAGATFISPFVGRIDDIGSDGMELIAEIRQIYDNYDFATEILVASVRTVNHVKQAALIGADVVTAPPAMLKALVKPSADRQGAGGSSSPTGPRPARRSPDVRAWTPPRSPGPFSRRSTAAARSSRSPAQDAGFSETDAYAVTAELRALRIARGEKPVGRKIGFTNRNIWAEYGVYQPIWGDIYDTTVRDVRRAIGSRFRSCRSRASSRKSCSGWDAISRPAWASQRSHRRSSWVAHGFEFVQSIFPGWRFQVADCVADGGLHGRLFIGPRRELSDDQRGTLASRPVAPEDQAKQERRHESTPVSAQTCSTGRSRRWRIWSRCLAKDALNPPLRAGEIVTTGTLTRAFPVLSGERWSTEIKGIDLPGLSVEIA